MDKGNYNFRPAAACQKLEAALLAMESSSPLQVQPLRRITRSRDKADNVHIVKDYDPVIILAFDEAHTLTNRVVNNSATWSNFSTLRRVLRALHRFSLFSLFLSTTGKISQFTSGKHEDVSLRIILGLLILIQPFTDLGFDTLAHAIRLGLDLEEAAADCHMVHLGRPL